MGFLQAALLTLLGGFVSAITILFLKPTLDNRRIRKVLARSLRSEIKSLWARYEDTYRRSLHSDNPDDLPLAIVIQEDYCSVFNSNCDKLGLFTPLEAEAITALYISAKGFIDELRFLGRELDKYYPYRFESGTPRKIKALEYLTELKKEVLWWEDDLRKKMDICLLLLERHVDDRSIISRMEDKLFTSIVRKDRD